MMPSDRYRHIAVEIAWRRYESSLRQGSTPCRGDGNSAGQVDNYREAAERAEMRYAQVKKVLNDFRISPCQFVAYRGFGLHVDKLFRDYSAEALRARVLDAILRWQCYGCCLHVLRAICGRVFGLEVE
ncbi:MAG TPA: hypothetical protein VM223_01215 [Planctomycetota bacterium]|nr:hypothetical protein [Planctomycetota bacterium]